MLSRTRVRGFTLMEVIVVVGILSVLAGLLTPTYRRGIRSAQEAANLQRLHQCQVAMALYQIDHGSESAVGKGLPGIGDVGNARRRAGGFYGTYDRDWQSACGHHPSSRGPNFSFFFDEFTIPDPVDVDDPRAPLLADDNCNDPGVDVRANYMTKVGFAVRADGSLSRRRGKGLVGHQEFWIEE